MGFFNPDAPPQTQAITALGSTSLTIPGWARFVKCVVKNAGGGGGSGRRGASSSIRTGGDGGAGGGMESYDLPVSYFGGTGSTIPIYVGDGGVGGALIGVDSTNGSNGRPGHSSGIGCVVDYSEVGEAAHVFNSVAYSPSLALFCMAGSSGTILTSPDGVTWTGQNSGVATTINALIWVASLGLFIGVTGGNALTSSNGTTWTTTATGGAALTDICFDATTGNVVACGSNSVVTSTNGTSWTSGITYGGSGNFPVIATDGLGHFVIVDGAGNVSHATNPTATANWTVSIQDTAGYFSITYLPGAAVPWIALTQQGKVATMATFSGTLTNNGAVCQGLITTAPGDTVAYSYNQYTYDGVTWYGAVSRFGVGGIRGVVLLNGVYYACNIVGAPSVTQFIKWYAVPKWNGLGQSALSPVGGLQGTGGLGGNATAAGTATVGGTGMFTGGSGSAHSSTANAAAGGSGAGGGGGAGGSADASNTVRNASVGGDGGTSFGGPTVGHPSNFTTQTGTWPTSVSASGIFTAIMGGGGNGGVFAVSSTGMAGAAGGTPGGGGGGGSASDNTFASGAGGKGGAGEVQVIFY